MAPTKSRRFDEPLIPKDAAPYSRGNSLHDNDPSARESMSDMSPSKILRTFILMAICFSANHGAVTACLGLSSARLGELSYLGADLGTWQSGTLYITYTLSAVFGAAHIVKQLGSRNGVFAGLVIYCVYVACFLVVAVLETDKYKWPAAIVGAAIGGVGGGFLWTAQGAYFGKTAEAYARATEVKVEEATAYLSGVFAFFYLAEEVVLKMLSTVLTNTDWGLSWEWWKVFVVYTQVSAVSIARMIRVTRW